MFVDRLRPDQRQVLYDIAVMLAEVDNDVSIEELDYLKDFSEAYEVSSKLEPIADDRLDDALRLFDTYSSKVILLQELIKLSYKDGHFDKSEQDKVLLIAQKIGLNDPDLILRIESWVREGVNWLYEGEALLEPKPN